MSRDETIAKLIILALAAIFMVISYLQGWHVALFLWTLSFGYTAGKLAQAHLAENEIHGRHR